MSNYNDFCSPYIISNPSKWVTPAGLCNPFNPIKLFNSETKEEIKVNNSFPSSEQPFFANTFEAFTGVLIFLLFIIFLNKLLEK